MKFRRLLLALIFAALASDSALPASKKDQAVPEEQKAATDQRGTEQFPFVVQPLPTKKTAEIAQQEKRDAKEKIDSDWWTWLLGVLTIVALFGQLAVFIAQAYYLKGTLKATEIAALAAKKAADLTKEAGDRQAIEIQDQIRIGRDGAQAAQKSADAAVASERARFYVVIEHNFLKCIENATAYENTPSIDETTIASSNLPMARFKFRNYGKTPGNLVEVSSGIVFSEGIPDPSYDEKIVRDNIIPYDQTSEEFSEVIQPSQMTFAQAKKVRSGEGHIWIFGKASYDDVFGERQIHRFFQRLVGVGPGRYRFVLQAYDYKHYNKST